LSRLLYIVDWLPPDYGANGQYALQESRRLIAEGSAVTLVGLTSGPSAVDHEGTGPVHLTLRRLHSEPVDKANLARRAFWTLKTNLRLLWAARRELWRADTVRFTGSPPFLDHLLVPLNLALRKRLVFRISDFHPESVIAELGRVPGWLSLLRALTVRWRRRVTIFEVLGEDQRRILLGQGVAADRVILHRSASPVTISPATRPLPIPDALAGRVVLLYSGAVAYAHDYDTFVAGYVLHHRRGTGRVGLWLNATGVRADRFEQAVREARLPLHRGRTVPLEQLASLLVSPHAHLITLRDEYVGVCMPSKVYGCIESRRDILYVGSQRSDVHLLCQRHLLPGAYFQVDVGDVEGVARSLEAVADRAASSHPTTAAASSAVRDLE
jgi:hypothetical protein